MWRHEYRYMQYSDYADKGGNVNTHRLKMLSDNTLCAILRPEISKANLTHKPSPLSTSPHYLPTINKNSHIPTSTDISQKPKLACLPYRLESEPILLCIH